MRQYGVIGLPIKHSFSPAYFTKKFEELGIENCRYAAYELADIAQLKALVHDEKLRGFNVTIPYKQTIIPYLDYISESAAKINAVNTVTVKKGKLYGDNTDYLGFDISIRRLIHSRYAKALIFGTGGSSLAVSYALSQMGVHYASVSRANTTEFSYDTLTPEDIAQHHILINTTPLGMSPYTAGVVSIPFDAIGPQHVCYDLVYTPSETLFLCNAKARGAVTKNGLEMLEIQADKSWDIWSS